jgi:sugar phosphate isomerase/epimerase
MKERMTDARPIYWSPHGGVARDWAPQRLFDVVAAAGYAGTEIWMDRRWLDWSDPADVARIRADARRRNLETPVVCCRRVPGLEPTDPAHAIDATRYLEDCIRVGAACGADTLLCYPGVPEGVPYRDAWSTCRDVLAALGPACRDAGIGIAIEFESPGPVLLGTPPETLRFIAETGDHVSACADTYHLHNRGIDQGEGVRQLEGHLTLAHLSDSERRTPGEGTVDFPSFFAGLRDVRFAGRLFVQCGPASEAEIGTALDRARAWAAVLGASAGGNGEGGAAD